MTGRGRIGAASARERLMFSREDSKELFNLPDMLTRLPMSLVPEHAARPGGQSMPLLADLFDQDQQDRTDPDHVPDDLSNRDRRRRVQVMELLAAQRLVTTADAYHAAMILQHARLPEHFHLGFELARRAAEAGHPRARWLTAAAMDRWLVHKGLPQRFGTQQVYENGRWRLPEIDPSTTDEDRIAWGVPRLSELTASLQKD